MTPEAAAVLLREDLELIATRAVALIWKLWERVEPSAIAASWDRQLPTASAILVAAQTVSAELADPYLAASTGTAAGVVAAVAADGFAGWADGALTVTDLLGLAAGNASARVQAGADPGNAVRATRADLAKYVVTTSLDAGRLSTTTAMVTRPAITGYYRMLVGTSCPRCAILAGRFYKLNEGFERHPNCNCVHRPAEHAGDGSAFDARKAIERGDVTRLSEADRRAIVEFGADPSQVVNAKAGMYKAGGRKFTTTGTTRTSIGGARILARDAEALTGADVSSKTFTNLTFSREQAAQYAELLRAGTKFSRSTSGGRAQTYTYKHTRTPRPTPETILAEFPDRADALRELTNFGYVI